MVDVNIFFMDDTALSVEDVDIDEGLTRLIVTEPNGDYSVVPLVNVKYYDVIV